MVFIIGKQKKKIYGNHIAIEHCNISYKKIYVVVMKNNMRTKQLTKVNVKQTKMK